MENQHQLVEKLLHTRANEIDDGSEEDDDDDGDDSKGVCRVGGTNGCACARKVLGKWLEKCVCVCVCRENCVRDGRLHVVSALRLRLCLCLGKGKHLWCQAAIVFAGSEVGGSWRG